MVCITGGQPRLLLVDDHQLNVRVMYEMFRHEFDVFIALNGEQALEKCYELHPDLILLDVVMPRMDGYEVCRRLKADPELADIPVIFITSHLMKRTKSTDLNWAQWILSISR